MSIDTTSQPTLTTLHGSKVRYLGPGTWPHCLRVVTEDGFTSDVQIADFQPSEALRDVLANPRVPVAVEQEAS